MTETPFPELPAERRREARAMGVWLMPDGSFGPRVVPGAPMPAAVDAALRACGCDESWMRKIRGKAGCAPASPARAAA